MKSIEGVVASAKEYASDDTHGYSQDFRDGPDYDCSSLIRRILLDNGFNVSFTWTGNMLSDLLNNGFQKVENVNLASGSNLMAGDILLYHNDVSGNGHTAIYVGDGKLVHASQNELGGVTGGQTGDQTGKEICETPYFNFPWMYVLRYLFSSEDDGTIYYTVQPYDSLWSIAKQFNTTIDKIVAMNNIKNPNLIMKGQKLKIREQKETAELPVSTDDSISITIKNARIHKCVRDGNSVVIEVEALCG